MHRKVIAIALTLCLIPTSTANSQGGVTSFNPDEQIDEISQPSTCREVLAIALQNQGQPFDPRTQDILDITLEETSGIIDSKGEGLEVAWLMFQSREWRAVPFLSNRLIPVEPNIYRRRALAEDAAIAIAYARLHPLCNPDEQI